MANNTKLSKEMKKTLEENGYQKSGDYYVKQRPDGQTIIAVENGDGVILHLGDEDGNIKTRIEQPAIYPTIQVNNSDDLLSAEKSL